LFCSLPRPAEGRGAPGRRRPAAIAELRRRKPALGIIVATGQGPEALDGSPRPAVLFIGKPFSEPELREALARLGAPQPA